MRHRLFAGVAAVVAAVVLAAVVLAAVAPAGAADTPAEPPAPADEALVAETPAAESPAAEAPPETPSAEPAPDEKPPDEKPPDGKPPAEEPAPDGPRALKLEDIRDLPILKRYNLPFEKGEELLSDVKDNTFDYDESAFWWVVHIVSRMAPEAFEPHEVTVGFPELLAMPSSYRGTPVTIRGMYMTCSPFETPILAIRKDIPTLYVCNIRELPIEEERPVATVICIEDPMTYLRVGDVVKVRGYFYKVRAYQGSKGPGLAPMLITQRLVPEGRRLGAAAEGEEGGGLLAAGGTSCVVLMVAAVLVLGGLYVYLRFKTKATPHAARESTGHRIRLRRPGRDQPPADARPGGEGGRPKP